MNTERLSYTGRIDAGAWCRALDLAREMFAAGMWNGADLLVIHNPYELHGRVKGVERLPVTALQVGRDFDMQV